MKNIYEAHGATLLLLGEQKISNDTKYRPLTFLRTIDVNDGKLVYNFMTGELILLSYFEYDEFQNCSSVDSKLVRLLIRKWFIVPQDHDDANLSRQLKQLLSTIVHNNTDAPMRIFTILPTTDCNARCFYCFELGRSRKDMTEKTASDVANYIITSSKGADKIKLRWFGGEPLYNSKVIDIICTKLHDANINFFSNFVSNGYLFDDEAIKRGKEIWNINDVQITLDGTEEIYNRCKAFIYRDGRSAFKVVTDNMERLLEADIGVKVRMNMDAHNEQDLYKLADYLSERFGKYNKFLYYVHLLFEDSGKVQMERSDFERHEMIRKFFAFDDYVRSKQNYPLRTVKKLVQYNQCMADDPTTTIISPDGELGRCEHYSDTDFWGSIYSKEINQDVIDDFKRTKYLGTLCDKCAMYPMCIQLIRCAQTIPNRCDDVDKQLHNRTIDRIILETYDLYNKENKTLRSNNDEVEVQDDC